MTYHLSGFAPIPPWPGFGLQGLGALGAAQVPPACAAWITTHYNAHEYERIRGQELPQLLREMPNTSWGFSADAFVGKPLPWAAFSAGHTSMVDPARPVTLRGLFGLGASITGGGAVSRDSDEGRLAALQRREYAAFTDQVVLWLQKVVSAFNRMGIALNLPTCWLLPSNPNTPHTAPPPAADQIIVDFADPVPPPAASYGRITGSEALGASGPPNPATIHWRNLPFSLLHATRSGTTKDTWYGKRHSALSAFWRDFQYNNTPVSPRNRAGYPADARYGYTIDIPPAAVTVKDTSGFFDFMSADGGGGIRFKLYAGPIYALWYAQQYIHIISRRPAAEVLGNAFETWAGVLTVWADAPANRHSTADKDKMKTAAAVLKTNAAAFRGAGAIATATGAGAVAGVPMIVFATAMDAFSAVLGVLPAARATMSSCTGDKAADAALRLSYHTTLGFCGPPTPLMFDPPSGCTPADALEAVRTGGGSLRPKSFWDSLLPILTHPATLGAVGLVAAYGVYRAVAPRKANSPALKNTAVKKMQAYLGVVDRAPLSVQQRLYKGAMTAVQRLADKHGLSASDVFAQVEAEARRRGVRPGMPGQDY